MSALARALFRQHLRRVPRRIEREGGKLETDSEETIVSHDPSFKHEAINFSGRMNRILCTYRKRLVIYIAELHVSFTATGGCRLLCSEMIVYLTKQTVSNVVRAVRQLKVNSSIVIVMYYIIFFVFVFLYYIDNNVSIIGQLVSH